MTELQTVVELPEFQRRARSIMTDAEREAVITWIATNPEEGVSLGGGLRKIRIPREGGGKSGGFRTIYVFGGRHMPIFLITIFAKNEKANLSSKEQAATVEMSKAIVSMWSNKQ
ncbi:type II toxin-antitoxin system RelE/ParE family toxin [Ochrobactrum sp. SFR4]|uniref:type II toxin-antitoxin system RelE/ParE family toxin n=1 Tax=Ochrobactrum sp. SFR4 TaxID=2717368 RepID=UPI001C8C2643|nr:type II toxin-antitoxin system RelE/ParE family toxin [Ochrobactrum sp. SFR4]MBX8803182.1 type II toxin-antitoxin system RelE/ParE family toxin [Ochrobactrum sp. MR28]MBX8818752.1 type II toxin-antitoxin system RelE/ParE family toxin [Ochrobactrum sp. MR31]MBX8827519.1 type II toxin-antitoxin system RelE/ParE family toxin [Ochrobactrum sp. SFR4]